MVNGDNSELRILQAAFQEGFYKQARFAGMKNIFKSLSGLFKKKPDILFDSVAPAGTSPQQLINALSAGPLKEFPRVYRGAGMPGLSIPRPLTEATGLGLLRGRAGTLPKNPGFEAPLEAAIAQIRQGGGLTALRPNFNSNELHRLLLNRNAPRASSGLSSGGHNFTQPSSILGYAGGSLGSSPVKYL